MTILDKIIEYKRKEVVLAKSKTSIEQLMGFTHFNQAVPSLKEAVTNSKKTGIIAEHKRQSPSKGVINDKVAIKDVVMAYEEAGSSAISVLTDAHFFGGSNDDLTTARNCTSIPILRKDFIIDPYQVYEAKAIGASAILLIAAVLTPVQAKDLGALANSLGLEVLMEFHDPSELNCMNAHVDVAGINNRNLKTFEVDLEKSIELAQLLPTSCPKIAESGIHSLDAILYLHQHGFDGFLIGENFMKSGQPGEACKAFSKSVMEAIRITK